MRNTMILISITLLAGCDDDGGSPANHDLAVATGDAFNADAETQGLTTPSGFYIETIAAVASARQLAALPNGDLLVATDGTQIFLVPTAEGTPGAPVVFAEIDDAPSQGITFVASTSTIYFASQHGVYSLAYTTGQTSGTPTKIASVRTGAVAPNSDGDVHTTSSVGFANGTVYAGVGSSCNACVEVDPTRATVQQMGADGSSMTTKATRVRNAIALAANPDTGTMWIGGAGQDALPLGHPYEFFDALTLHAGVADYGWPACEENQNPYGSGADCSHTMVPLVELPAYSTIIGAVFYPASQGGAYAFPSANRGLYISAHGSWHMAGQAYFSPPQVVFVAMNGDQPVTPVDWNDPSKQWTQFVGGFQLPDGMTRIGRPTGITVGKEGSLFVGDDQNGWVYRVRPE